MQGHPYDRLTPDTVLDAIESRGYLSDARILALNSYENRVYQVGLDSGDPLIAKFYRPARWSDEQILEDHAFTQELAMLEIPVVPPLSLDEPDGGEPITLARWGGFRFTLYPRKGGQAPELDNYDNLLILGRFLGRIHAAGRSRPFAHRPALEVQNFGIDSYRYLLDHHFIPDELIVPYRSLCEDLIDKLERTFARTPYTPIRLHGDCHPGNILWRDQAPHFVDFDDARNGPAVQDLWMLLSGDRQQQTLQLSEILEGYQQFCDFNFAELALIEGLRTLRIMHYAAWLARRWEDPAFPHNFPWFNTQRYWAEHILELREQLAAMDEPQLVVI
ncbi:serine/threonine protein kinase [Exilibacterium tricleocarpae]|uniref:Stress response kinase A n=1 Tax=Exilibacterium tricleocarpae TaxID=2591008 RepID=A0A545T3P4_9GAMM|nr:serine/threonine protein kinase [Exilibacterium tricleocarpae]TQV71837.1 serine/threonine protein kinase [Exilibacterium tricleocarpae]